MVLPDRRGGADWWGHTPRSFRLTSHLALLFCIVQPFDHGVEANVHVCDVGVGVLGRGLVIREPPDSRDQKRSDLRMASLESA